MRKLINTGHQGRGMPIPESNELFIEEAIETRAGFVKAVSRYSPDDDLFLRTEADSLLIMYDQMIEKLRA